MLLYVDYIILMGKDKKDVETFKHEVVSNLNVKDLEALRFLGLWSSYMIQRRYGCNRDNTFFIFWRCFE